MQKIVRYGSNICVHQSTSRKRSGYIKKAVLYIKSKYYLAETEREKEGGETVIWDNTEEIKEMRRFRSR